MDKWKYPSHKSFIVDLNNATSHQDRERQQFATTGTQTETQNDKIKAAGAGSAGDEKETYPMRIPVK